MALIENFYNGDRARDIREVLTQNFANVAKYIPNDFLILSTVERQNLTDDYKTHFKLVFDNEQKRVYRWSDIQRNWEMYLIYAWDEYARREANSNADSSFASVELGINESGAADPYTFTFYSRAYNETDGATGRTIYHPAAPKDSISLTGANIKYNNQYSVATIIDKILTDFDSLNNFVGTRTDITDNADLTATTVCGAIKEINNKTIDNKTRLDNIESGATKVPEAIHAEHADLADIATLARDSEKLGGQLPAYYAKQSDLDTTNTLLSNTVTRVEAAESNINGLTTRINTTDANLSALDTRENARYQEQLITARKAEQNSTAITNLEDEVNVLNSRLGWEVLLT